MANEKSAVEKAFDKAGGRHVIQEKLNLSKQTMADWKRWGYVPARHAAAVEAISGVPREELCPTFDWGPKERT